MGKLGILSDTFETIQEEAEKGVKTAASQLSGKPPKGQAVNQQGQAQSNSQKQGGVGAAVVQAVRNQITGGGPGGQVAPEAQAPAKEQEGKQETESFVKDLYGDAKPVSNEEAAKKEAEDAQKTEALRQQLHGEYYQKLITPEKRPEEAQKEQERASERVERLEMEGLQEEKKKKEKEKPLPQEAKKTEAPMGAG